jgi:drug/metabolite transporter (DMT)-like permease
MLVGTLCCLVQFFSVHSVEALRLPMSVYGLAFAMAIFSTVLPNIFMSEGLRRIGANRAALVGTIGPVVTIALGAAVLGEHIGPLQFAGAGLVLVGVFLVSARPAVSTAA